MDNLEDPPAKLFERLQQIPGYTWNEAQIFHTPYDNWQIRGRKHPKPSLNILASGKSPSERTASGEPRLDIGNNTRVPSDSGSEAGSSRNVEQDEAELDVVARVSIHALREERSYYICKKLIQSVDVHGEHIVKPVDMMKLQSHHGDKGTIMVTIWEHAGPNYLQNVIDYGPAFYKGRNVDGNVEPYYEETFPLKVLPLQTFMDFAIGATECLEMLHHKERIVHGEIRGEAFHLCEDTGKIRLMNFGSGLRTFEHGLTSTGWSALSKENGAKRKLSFMSPEQTGRMPAEPDSRTDIYALGVVFWNMLTQQPPFEGETPMDIIQGVLGRRLPLVSSMRLDVPEVLGRIIQKMTAKIIGERYHSASGLKHDLLEVRTFLGAGDSDALENFQIATKDISSFFILPTAMIGRTQEYEEVVKIIDKVSKKHVEGQKQDIQSISSGSSEGYEIAINEASSLSEDAVSSAEYDRPSISLGRSDSLSGEPRANRSGSGLKPPTGSSHSSSIEGRESYMKPWEKHSSMSLEARSLTDIMSLDPSVSASSDSVGSLTHHRNIPKFRRKGRCEVVSISGATGLGKSCLIQSIQVEARRRGYFASSKFDLAKKTPFGPVLRLLSSLFKQVFSESNTDTSFHQALKHYCRPAWPLLHKALDLPEFLLGPASSDKPSHSAQLSQNYNKSVKSEFRRKESSPSNSRSSIYSITLGSRASQDFLRAGTSTKSLRLMNTTLDVLRFFTQHKFICFCLDDLQFADDESLELITQIVSARMKMVFLITYRPEEVLPDKIRGILEPPDTEEHIKAGGVGITRVVLRPLTESDIINFVAATLLRPKEDVIALSAVIQSKTAGNPFYMREMLTTCHDKQCIWYDYKQSIWRFSLDRIFKQFQTSDYHDTLNSQFITGRLNELPPASRSILAWASMLGTSFSFEMIQRLMSGEFSLDNETQTPEEFRPYSLCHSQQDAVEGLQAAIQAYVVVATQEDDRFRFAHDRYSQAARSLGECNAPVMHFIIAQTLVKYYPTTDKYKGDTALHISKCTAMISQRILHRQSYRKILFECSQAAAESGARSAAADYYASCFSLLQPDPWADGAPDVYYDETLQLHTRAAECFLFLGHYVEAKNLLNVVFSNAKSPVDKAPAYVLMSRVLAYEGDSPAAFQALKSCLTALGIVVDDEPSFDKCDKEFERLSLKVQSLDADALLSQALVTDTNLAAVGAVLVETISAAFWADSLLFYHMSLIMVDTQLMYGLFPQSGMGFLHLATIAISRFNMIKFATDVGKFSLEMMEKCHDPYTMGRGGTIYSLFVGHVHVSLQISLDQLEGALEYAIQAGDRTSTILNFGIVSSLKFFASESLLDLENFINYGCEEISNWGNDTRGGTMAISVRQVCRALQGKTRVTDPSGIMSDGQHDGPFYKSWLKTNVKASDRPLFIYESWECVPLFLYGHYARAIEVGERALENCDVMWSARNIRFSMFFQGLSLCGLMWSKLQNPLRHMGSTSPNGLVVNHGPSEDELRRETEEVIKKVKYFKGKIKDWQTVNNVNYFAWSRLLAAQIAELEGDHGKALTNYEETLDHASAHGFVFEEALGNHLYAGCFLRCGSRRAAKHSLREAVHLYRLLGATGVASAIEVEHNLLLQGATRNLRSIDVGCQTDFAGDSAQVQYRTLEGDEDDERQHTRAIITQTKGDRIGAWQVDARGHGNGGIGLPALDMLDLTSILESSQVISSVLQVDQLLKTMCEIILQNCGGLASSAAIVVEEDDPSPGWSIAASGDNDKGAIAHIPSIPLRETALVAEGVILYCTRFRETVFLPDILHDERFSNVTDAWSLQNPRGKSVIALPIVHGDKPLLGVLYLEGEPNAFTDRNLTVLQLLVNQIGISYSNALTLKEVEKVSFRNTSMVGMQKTALAKAQQAEIKAKKAEAEALASVKLAEEAAKAKSIFLANVSHELRTPLNGVIGNSELLRDLNLTKEQAEMADSIRVSADLLLTVINDILDFSKMEADKMELCIESFKPTEMIREIVRSVSYSYRDKKRLKNIEILQDVDLPDLLIYGDPVRLHQVLGNLLGNSMKFTETGSITVGARCDQETEVSATLTFWVKDTGIGIPSQQLTKLFKPFSQADASTARKYGGSGLGLSICKSLIESMMGGTIHLDSIESEGTTAWFTVTFDKVRSAEDGALHNRQTGVEHRGSPARFAESELPKSTTAHSDFSKIDREDLRICVAEDNPINQKIAIQFMEKLGYKHIDAYDNGLEAVQGLRRKANEGQPYHIVLMDVQMPVLDGYEATKLLRKDPLEHVRGVLVIAMTASAIQGDREKCLEAGMNDYLAKPVRVGILKSKLNQYLNQPNADVPNLKQAARQVTSQVLREVDGLQENTALGNSSATSSLQGQATDSHLMTSSSSVAAVSPSRTEHTSKTDARHRPSVIKHGDKVVDGDMKALDGSTVGQINVFDDDDSKPKIPVKHGRGIENKKSMRPSSSRRAASKDSVKGK